MTHKMSESPQLAPFYAKEQRLHFEPLTDAACMPNLVLSVMKHLSWPWVWVGAKIQCSKAVAQNLWPVSHCIIPSVKKKTRKCSNSLTWCRDTFPTWSGQSTSFLLRIMAWEVLILIPSAPHSAVNQSNECCRSQANDAISTTSTAESNYAIPILPNCNP